MRPMHFLCRRLLGLHHHRNHSHLLDLQPRDLRDHEYLLHDLPDHLYDLYLSHSLPNLHK